MFLAIGVMVHSMVILAPLSFSSCRSTLSIKLNRRVRCTGGVCHPVTVQNDLAIIGHGKNITLEVGSPGR